MIISTIYDDNKQTDPHEPPLRRHEPYTLKYRDEIKFSKAKASWHAQRKVIISQSMMIISRQILMSLLNAKSHIHGSPCRFYYGLNLTDDPGIANFRSLIRMHHIRMIKYYYIWLRMQYRKLRTSTDCHKCTSVANPVSSTWMCDLGIKKIWALYL